MIKLDIDDVNSSHFCRRGLEWFTQEGKKIRRENKEQAWHTVLCEQERQYYEGFMDADKLARMYSDCSGCSRGLARLVGVSDESSITCALEDTPANSSTASKQSNFLVPLSPKRFGPLRQPTRVLNRKYCINNIGSKGV
jgi:hypothetical protein